MSRIEGPPQARVRMKFAKSGRVRFLSHLDTMKSMERALRRAGLPVSYSEGFHPHMRFSFGPALALGHGSVAEWLDLDIGQPLDAEEVKAALNRALPPGLEILEARTVPLQTPTLGATLRRAVYRVRLAAEAFEGVPERLQALLAQQEIPLQKKNTRKNTNTNTKIVNVRSFVEDVRIVEDFLLLLTLRLGPEGSIRPEDVLAHLTEPDGSGVVAIERIALQQPRGDEWVDPWPDA
ncbi:MAG: DUF2344 domain-containing protein [Armatimonadetes bacterium]|nr:DUF2344 domain-containing protein [Armatimonadota bacterium]